MLKKWEISSFQFFNRDPKDVDFFWTLQLLTCDTCKI